MGNDRGVRVLAFAGSPRRGGNTDALLAAALEGAQAAGARIERHDLRALTIAACGIAAEVRGRAGRAWCTMI